jgi:hypothetical protein
MIQWFSFISNLSQTHFDGPWHRKDARPTYSCLTINLCFNSSYHFKKFGHGVFPHLYIDDNCQRKVTSVMNVGKLKKCVALEDCGQYIHGLCWWWWDRMVIVIQLGREHGIGPKKKLWSHVELNILNSHITEHHVWLGRALALYSGGFGFKSNAGERLSWLRFFMVFLCIFRKNTGIVPQFRV